MKSCSKCGILQPKQNFYKSTKSKDGLRSQCKRCIYLSRKSDRTHRFLCKKCGCLITEEISEDNNGYCDFCYYDVNYFKEGYE